jgi:hypothetical protein
MSMKWCILCSTTSISGLRCRFSTLAGPKSGVQATHNFHEVYLFRFKPSRTKNVVKSEPGPWICAVAGRNAGVSERLPLKICTLFSGTYSTVGRKWVAFAFARQYDGRIESDCIMGESGEAWLGLLISGRARGRKGPLQFLMSDVCSEHM